MYRKLFIVAALAFAAPLFASERFWEFSDTPTNQPPTNCLSTVAGEGKPGTWKVIMDDFPLALPPTDPNAPRTAPKSVVAQTAREYANDHYPMLILGNATYGDFTLKTKFKIVDGLSEQMAGVAFRIQDEKNFYYARVDANKISFCGVGKGAHHTLFSQDANVSKGVWHEITIECEGPKVHVAIDGEFLPTISDPTYAVGKIAYMTKSDAITYFGGTKIVFKEREPFAQVIVREVMKENPRLVSVKIAMPSPKATNDFRLIASNNEKEIGELGAKDDADVIGRGVNYFRKDKENVYVTMPLRDRNGDPVAAVEFVMRSFPGQTEDNALTRAMPLIKMMQKRAASVESLY